MAIEHISYSDSKDNEGSKRVMNAIVLKYPSEGETKTGIVKIHVALNPDDKDLEYKGVEYSDDNVQRYMENNHSVGTIKSVGTQA